MPKIKGVDDMPTMFKSMPMEAKANSTGNIVFKISTNVPDRDSDILEPSGVKLENYRNNPVVLFAHDYSSLPVGKSLWEKVYPDYIESEVEFAPTAFAQDCKKLCEGNFLNAASVGFIGIESEPIDGSQWGKRYTSWELLEWSVVPVPSNFGSLIQNAKAKGINLDAIEKELNQLENKSAIPYKKYPLADEGTTWDGPTEIAAASVDDLKIMCAWVDSTNAENKGAYKLPHHEQSDKKTVWRAVATAMGALLGARGGVDIPETDRKAVFSHLAKHYDDFGKTAPDFKNYSGAEFKAMFPEIKTFDLQNNVGVSEIIDAIEDLVDPLDTEESGVEELYPVNYPNGYVIIFKGDDELFLYEYTYDSSSDVATLGTNPVPIEEVYLPKSFKPKGKSGATLSAQNRETLTGIHKQIEGCHKDMKKFLDGTMPMEPGGTPMDTASMTSQMTMSMNPMMSGTRTVPLMETTIKIELSEEFKRAFDEIKNQMSLLIPKVATKGEINLDAIEYIPNPKYAAKDELNIEPGMLKNMMIEIISQQLKGGI